MDGLTWFFRLLDEVTGPATRMVPPVQQVGAALKDVDKAADKAGKGAKDALTKIDLAIGNWLGSLMTEATDLLKSLPGMALGLAEAGVAFAIDSAESKRNMTFAFTAMLGTADEARSTIDTLEGYARDVAGSKDAFVGSAQRLLQVGFQQDELKPLLAAMSDLKGAAGGDEKMASALSAEFARIRETGKFGARDLKALSNIGVSQETLVGAIAAQRGILPDQARQLIKANQVSGEQAINAILSTVSTQYDKGGPLGQLGKDYQAGSIVAQLQHVKDAFGDMFESIDMKPLTDFLGKITEGLSGGGAERITGIINEAFASLVGWLSSISLDDVISGFESLADGVAATWNFLKGLWDVGKAFVSGFAQGFEPLMPLMSAVFEAFSAGGGGGEAIDWMQTAIDLFREMGAIAGFSLGAVILVVETTAAGLYSLGRGIVQVVTSIGEGIADFVRIGGELVDGFWRGISAGWAAMLTKFHDLLAMLPASAKTLLGIASPSTVFAGFGLNVAEGFNVGVDRGDMAGNLADAMSFEAPGVASPVLSPGSSGVGLGPSARAPVIEIHVHLEGGQSADRGEELAEEIRRVVVPELVAAFDQLAVEMGGA